MTDGNAVARPASPSRRTRGVRARSRPSPSEGGKGRTSRRGKSIRDCLFCPRGTGCAGAGLRGLGRDRPPAGVIGASRSGLRHRVGERGPARRRIELEGAVRSDATEGFGVERPRPGLSKSARSGSGNGARAKRRSCLLWPSDRAHNRIRWGPLPRAPKADARFPSGPRRAGPKAFRNGSGRSGTYESVQASLRPPGRAFSTRGDRQGGLLVEGGGPPEVPASCPSPCRTPWEACDFGSGKRGFGAPDRGRRRDRDTPAEVPRLGVRPGGGSAACFRVPVLRSLFEAGKYASFPPACRPEAFPCASSP